MNKMHQNPDLSKTREKSDLQKLETQQTFFDTFLMQSARAEEVDQQHIRDRFAELFKKQKFSKIKYDQIRKTNEIKRREGKKETSGKINGQRYHQPGPLTEELWFGNCLIAEYKDSK